MRRTNSAFFVVTFVASIAYSPLALAAPTPGEILDAYKTATGGNAWNDKVTMESEFDIVAYGLTGKGHAVNDLKDGRSESDYRMGPASGANGYDGVTPWQKDLSGTVTLQQGGDAQVLSVNDAYRVSGKWWQPDRGGAAIASDGEKACGDATCEVLTITPKGGKPFDAWFDCKTHLLTKTMEKQSSQMVTTTMSDYRTVDGVVLPYKIVIDQGVGEKYLQTVTLTKVAFLGLQPDSAYAPPKVVVSDFSIVGGAPQTEIPFHLINNHIYGEAKINGKGPFIFIFDTGGRNLVTPPLAKQLGLKIEGKLPGTGAGEGVMEGGFTHVAELQVGNAVVKNQLFIVLPLDRLSAIEGTPMPAMVGYETFRRFVTRIDYGADTVTLIDPKHFDPKDAGTPIKFTFNDSNPEVMGTFEGLPAKYDIDTGARTELTLTKPFAEKNDLRAKHPKGVDAVDGWGVGGPSRGYITRGKEMTIGPITIDDVVTTMSTQDKGAFAGNDYQGNIGGGILKRFIVTFDYDHQMMYLKPLPGPIADTGTFDRAGMWFNQAPQGFDIVDVTKGAPAEQAGLKMGDVILAVDGKPADKIHLYDLRQRLRDDPVGTVATFRVKDGATVKDVNVTLRDLI
ncbi:MAG: aspartyl protease family protein [Alphaproteobacteria bacterium]|nr:aspartyl protease family protein [Alphaproteobacteria bacterium]